METVDMNTALHCLKSVDQVLCALTQFVRDHCSDKLNFGQIVHTKYKVGNS